MAGIAVMTQVESVDLIVNILRRLKRSLYYPRC